MRHIPLSALAGGMAILGLAAGAEAAGAAAQKTQKKIELGACAAPGLPPEARCGIHEVFENRAARSGRKIPLRVALIPALGPERLPDPLVYFAGGPGDSSVQSGGWLAQEMKGLRQRRDILLVDLRGTGGSAALQCPELQGSVGLQGFLDDFLPADKVRACRERLQKTADLTQYTSDNAIDDVEEVRAALGYGKINLMGGSYGTRAALIYLRRHPQSVRTVTLLGVVPLDERGPFSMARNAQNALDGLIAECEGDAACRAAFPKLREEVAAVVERAAREPVRVELTDPETGRPAEVRLSRNGVGQTLRYMLYIPSSSVLLPLNVHLAARGDWKPFAETASSFGRNMTSLADGFYLGVTCSEDIPFIREEDVPATVAGTFLGDFRIRKQQEACAAWTAARLGREFLEPVVSDVPALVISGERDPVTPPANGDRVARTLKRSLHVVVPDGAHSFGGMKGAKCVDDLTAAFIESGKVEGLDTSCVQRIERPEFVLKLDPEIPVRPEDLARLTGRYHHPEIGMQVQVDIVGGHLRATLDESQKMILVPTAPARFRIEGMPPGFTVEFQLADGRAASLLVAQPGMPPLALAREGV